MSDIAFRLSWPEMLALGVLALAPVVFLGGTAARAATGSGASAALAGAAALICLVLVADLAASVRAPSWLGSGFALRGPLAALAAGCWIASALMPGRGSRRGDLAILGALALALLALAALG